MKKTFFQKIPVGYAMSNVYVVEDFLFGGWSVFIGNVKAHNTPYLLQALLFVRWYCRHS